MHSGTRETGKAQGKISGATLTGHAEQPVTGLVPVHTLEVKDENLPLRIAFAGRKYVMVKTPRGGLMLNGAT